MLSEKNRDKWEILEEKIKISESIYVERVKKC